MPLSTKGQFGYQNVALGMPTTTFKRFVILSFLGSACLLFVAYFSESWMANGLNHIALLYSSVVNYSTTTANETSVTTTRKVSSTVKVILIYTPFFEVKEWPGINPNLNMSWRGIPCSVRSCEWTYDKQRFSESDLVIFHARNMPRVRHLEMLRQTKPPHQRWGYFLLESPQATPNTIPLNGFFHWTITYRRDSDFWSPYGSYTEISNANSTSLLTKDFSEGKDKLVAWLVSNCGPQLRKSFVHELQKYINVDVFGGCSKEFGGHKPCLGNCKETLSRYKFYLGLENALCLDYVTEKYWVHLADENLVPIVMSDPKWFPEVAIPGSYINVLDFKSVKDVAAYLQYLDKNTTAYNEFFHWRLKYKEILYSFPGGFFAPNPWHCHVCEALNSANTSRPQPIMELTDFWLTKAKCGEMDNKVKEMF